MLNQGGMKANLGGGGSSLRGMFLLQSIDFLLFVINRPFDLCLVETIDNCIFPFFDVHCFDDEVVVTQRDCMHCESPFLTCGKKMSCE